MLYRGIDLHDKVIFDTNENKNIFITNANDTETVKVPIYLKDISDYFRQLNFPLEFCDYNISIQVVDEIYYKTAAMNILSQTIKSAYLFTDVCYLDEKNNLDYLKNVNKFNKTIPIFDNNVVINRNKIAATNFTIHVNNVYNVYNCKNMYLMFIKDNSVVKIPNKSCSNIQLKVNSEKFQNVIEDNIDAFLIFKNRSPYTNEFLLNYDQFLNNYLIYGFPLDRMLEHDSGNKSIIINGKPADNSSSTAIIIYQQASIEKLKKYKNPSINLKKENILKNGKYKLHLTVGMFNKLLEQGQLRYVFTDKRKQYYIQNGGSLANIFKAILPHAKDFAKKIIPSLVIAASSTLVSHGVNKALNKKKRGGNIKIDLSPTDIKK